MQIQKSIFFYITFISISILLSSCVYYRTALEEEYSKQGSVAYSQGDYQLALEYYNKVKKISLNNNARYTVAEINIRLGNYEEARKEIDTLLQRDSNNQKILELDAYWYFSIGNIEEAIKKYKALLEITPYNERILSNLAIIYQQMGDYQQSLAYFSKVLESPSYVLSIVALNSYISSIQQERASGVADIDDIHLTIILDHFLTAQSENNIEIPVLFQVTEIIREINVAFAYPLYLVLANAAYDSDNTELEKLVTRTHYIIAQMIFSKEYIPLDTEPFEKALFHLEKAITLGFGRLRGEGEELQTLREEYLDTVVLQQRVAQLYYDNELLGTNQYKEIIASLEDSAIAPLGAENEPDAEDDAKDSEDTEEQIAP